MKKMFLFLCLSMVGCMPMQHSSNYGVHEKGEYSVIPIVEKDFIIKDYVFVESTVTINSDGKKEGSEITSDMLMREAQKLGADDVVNVKIDKTENVEFREHFSGRSKKFQIIRYKAVGLAIKYK